jgi:hypothetical protein
MHMRPEFFDIALDLSIEFGLPLSIPGFESEANIGFPARQLAAEEGVVVPDNLITRESTGTTDSFEDLLDNLEAGVTVLSLHPSVDSPELRAADPHWRERVQDFELLTSNPAVRDAVQASGAKVIGFRALRDLMRSADSRTAGSAARS